MDRLADRRTAPPQVMAAASYRVQEALQHTARDRTQIEDHILPVTTVTRLS